MDAQKKTFIDCGIFEGLDDTGLADCMKGITTHTYRKDDILIEKDKASEGLFIIHTGLVGIFMEDILLAQLGPSAIIGESFIGGMRATASSVAMEDTTVYIIDKDQLFQIIQKYPRVIQNLFAQTIHRLRNSNDAALAESRTRADQLKMLVDERTAELHTTLSELRHTQQFRDRFLANMSHEIRTPMNAIVGLTNLLVSSPLNDQQKKYLQVIKKSGDNLIVIINDILDLSKIEAGKMELEKVSFSLKQTLENIKTILEIKALEKGIRLELQVHEHVPEFVLSDETRLTQILINLTGNAIKFTESGAVTISAQAEHHDGKTAHISFKVEDTGIGIPEDKLEKIFESFGQASSDTTRKYGGTGLGLNIAKQLVELYGGNLQVSSIINKGSTFYFTIPMEISESPTASTHTSQTGELELSQLKILLVEDNLFNQMVAQDTLELLFPGCGIDLAADGKTAIALASSNDYSIILMDVRLPDLDGFEVTKFIRKELDHPKNNVPICAMTASVSKERIEECLSAGMNDYMYKPFKEEVLRQKVISNVLNTNKNSRFEKVKQYILQRLNNELPTHYTYHNAEHTMDVLQSAEAIASMEHVDETEMELLKAAALFHDTGFLVSAIDHETYSAQLAGEILPQYAYTDSEIEVIKRLIEATRSPQKPTSMLEMILCDADLDYLGREDYFIIAERLKVELAHDTEKFKAGLWNETQVGFLAQHRYFTQTALEMRNNKKLEHLAMLKENS